MLRWKCYNYCRFIWATQIGELENEDSNTGGDVLHGCRMRGNGLAFCAYPDGRERCHQRDYEWRPGAMLHLVECDNLRPDATFSIDRCYCKLK